MTAEHGDLIARKLIAERVEGRGHARVYVKWNGSVVASYGIRRGSRELPHDYISRQIFVTIRQALDLARCPMSRDEYFDVLRMHGHLPED